ncbi:hypothetical protein BaRGS_00007344, partial [Batillaria attramentaria]
TPDDDLLRQCEQTSHPTPSRGYPWRGRCGRCLSFSLNSTHKCPRELNKNTTSPSPTHTPIQNPRHKLSLYQLSSTPILSPGDFNAGPTATNHGQAADSQPWVSKTLVGHALLLLPASGNGVTYWFALPTRWTMK